MDKIREYAKYLAAIVTAAIALTVANVQEAIELNGPPVLQALQILLASIVAGIPVAAIPNKPSTTEG